MLYRLYWDLIQVTAFLHTKPYQHNPRHSTGVATRCWRWGRLRRPCCWRCRLPLATLLDTAAASLWSVCTASGQKIQQHYKIQKKEPARNFFRKCILSQDANLWTLNFSWRSAGLVKLSTLSLLKNLRQIPLQAGIYPLAVNEFKLSRFCLPCCKDQSYYYSNLPFPFHPSGGHCGKVINFCVGDFKSLMPFCVWRKKSICSFWSRAYLCFSHFLSL